MVMGLPSITISTDELERGIELFRLVATAGLAPSNGAARRLIRQGGIRVNNVVIKDETRLITNNDIIEDIVGW
jgi:tyrosyl-tRNA synthetase